MATLTYETTLESTVCGGCGVQFAMPSWLLAQLRAHGETFYCPNGHQQCFRESETKKLQKELARERARLDQTRAELTEKNRQLAHTGRRLTATQGVVTRTKNRVSKGVCPCCKRHFLQLQRHMRSKHPEYANEESSA